jgi:hypothetical protein
MGADRALDRLADPVVDAVERGWRHQCPLPLP